MRRKLDDVPIVRPDHAGQGASAREIGAIGEKATGRNENRDILGNGLFVAHANEAVFGAATGLNERHRRAP
jgi:hypothetical protein